jgi:hypothetical protein
VRDLDRVGADIKIGDHGVVFEEADFYGDGNGPMVSWIKRDGGYGSCNVYEDDVIIVR